MPLDKNDRVHHQGSRVPLKVLLMNHVGEQDIHFACETFKLERWAFNLDGVYCLLLPQWVTGDQENFAFLSHIPDECQIFYVTFLAFCHCLFVACLV